MIQSNLKLNYNPMFFSMDVFHLGIFQREVARQCDFAMMAHNDLEQVVNQLKRAGMLDDDNMYRIWYYIQNLLVAVGNISKLLWPPDKKFHGRGQQLRNSLNAPQNSSLEPRIFRNHFEHFDERLEEWISSSKSQSFIDSNIGGPLLKSADIKDYLRNFDHVNYIVTFWGESYQLKQIMQEIKNLGPIAHTEGGRNNFV